MRNIHPIALHRSSRRGTHALGTGVLAALLGLSLLTTQASPLVDEGFGGYSTGAISGQSTSAGTTGLTGNYLGTTAMLVQSTGLSFGDLSVSGGALNTSGSPSTTLTVSLASTAATTGALYASFLFQTTVAGTDSAHLSVGPTAHFRTYASFGAGAATSYDGSNRSDTFTNLAANTVYLCITKMTNVGLSLSPATTGTQQSWFLTEAQFATWEANGMSESYLNSATKGTGANQIYARTSAVSVTSGIYLFDGTQNLILSASNNNHSVFDEIRFGTTLGDVVVVPEPGTMLLLTLSCLILSGRRLGKRL